MKTLIVSTLFVAATAVAVACPVAEKKAESAKATPVVQSPGKSTAGVAVDYRLLGKPAVGVPLQLDIGFDALDAAALSVDINAPAELGFAAGRLQREVVSGDKLNLTLVPQMQGRYYVNVTVRNTGNGLARAVSIPVQVGATARKASKAVTTPAGELIVRLPAAE